MKTFSRIAFLFFSGGYVSLMPFIRKPFFIICLFLFIGVRHGLCQDSAVLLSAKMLEVNRIVLPAIDGWIFKLGNDSSWSKVEANTSDWLKLKPAELSTKYADKTGKVEGWFRFKFILDTDFHDMSLGFRRGGWAATDLYIDGRFIASLGNTGTNGTNFREYNPIDKKSIQIKLETGKDHLLAIHFVDYLSPFPPRQLKSASSGGVRLETSGLKFLIILTAPKYDVDMLNNARETLFYRSIWLSVTLLLALLFWLLVFINPNEKKALLLIAIFASLSALSNLTRFFLTDPDISFVGYKLNDILQKLSYWMILVMGIVMITTVLGFKLFQNSKYFLFAYSTLGAFAVFFSFSALFVNINTIIVFLAFSYILFSRWKKLKGAQWAIAIGLLLTILFATLIAFTVFQNINSPRLLLLTFAYFSFPLSLVVYVSLRFREIIREVQKNAKEIVRLSEEKREHALYQQAILEQQVKERTAELSQSLDNLKSTQAQLIQSEKMASLGELTAGIAHEIQNPLNFVNNFSELNSELVDELRSELATGNPHSAKEIADTIKENEEKINHHGKRADAIVKSMLQHSRASSGKKEPTDVNALVDEYLRLAYHGLRAKDKSFNATFETDLDNSAGKINIIPQDIGRVLLNLFTNAFYSVTEKHKSHPENYNPVVFVSTKKLNGRIEIKVRDNGMGIPQKVLDKIFQPFFTTKPTGAGTGLGLSLSYDIVVKGHGGELRTETKEGEFAEFIIQLPV